MINKKIFKVLALSVAIILLASGCAFRGGGWMPSTDYQNPDMVYDEIDEEPTGKATFGFTAKYDEKKEEAKGQFQYNDKDYGFKFHGEITHVSSFEVNGFETGQLVGEYVEDGEVFRFLVLGADNGVEGVDALDYIYIHVRDPQGNIIYKNEGLLGGGTLKFWN